MNILKAKNYEEMCRKAANLISAQIIIKPNSVLGLATGSTPIGIYDLLAKRCADKDLNFSAITSINLDEYCGLPEDNAQSYRYFMQENLFSKVNICAKNTYVPQGLADPDEECKRYDELIETCGGIDLQLLGLGHNGHIGFNEPCDHFKKGTHCVQLSETTIEANRRFFDSIDDVPKKAITVGIGAIMQARHVLLAVNGKDKADILNRVLNGPITPEVPASILQLHSNCTVIASVE